MLIAGVSAGGDVTERTDITVSIITPAYNAEDYLTETVRSVLAQTFGDFEMLIVDDGSTDRTAEIAERFSAGDSRIQLIRQSNAGPSAARNAAIRRARGRYLALLDSDDLWMPTYLADQLAILAAHPEVDVVSANAVNLGGPTDGLPLRPVDDRCVPITLLDMIATEDSVCIMSLFRRTVVDKVRGFDSTLCGNEDYDFWLRAACAGCRFLFNLTPSGRYRRRPSSLSSDELRMLTGIIGVLARVRPLCDEGSVERQTLDRQIIRFSRERLLTCAKAALLQHDFRQASRHFADLSQVPGNAYHRALGRLGQAAPRLLLWAYSAKAVMRRPARPAA
jgi:glycosyltransferase involved in cell wall biosynthesis